MPLTTSGKLQRSACAAQWAQEKGLDSVAIFVGGRRRYGAPAAAQAGTALSPIEATIAEVWRAVLRLETVGRDDDFFLLGGNSIAAAEVTAALQERCRVAVELSAVFVHTTLQAFASHLDSLPHFGRRLTHRPGAAHTARAVARAGAPLVSLADGPRRAPPIRSLYRST